MRRKQTDEHGSDPRLEPQGFWLKPQPRRPVNRPPEPWPRAHPPSKGGPICPEGKPDESGWRGPTLWPPPALARKPKYR
jgi:hypothetical protein